MKLNEEQKQFIREHAADDLSRLLLSASKYSAQNVPFLIEQIAARRQIREKLPSWYENDELLFPVRIAAEQCSSELTALYKQGLVEASECLCDLTGGLGIDSYFFSRKVKKLTYIERFAAYCEVAKHNFEVLGADNIEVINADIAEYLLQLPPADVFYIDPARRGESNKRVFALPDCEPDLPKLLPSLLERAPKVIAKLSPMADIQFTLDLLPGTTEVHVISVKNECKELLFVVERENKKDSPQIVCVNFAGSGRKESFSYAWHDERDVNLYQADRVKHYLYEPNASILKAGAFRMTAFRFGLEKLHASSHLYTSDNLRDDFPGRRFVVDEVIPFSNKQCKALSKTIPQANITVRNFPLSVAELRVRTKIADGGEVYLFATTLTDGGKVLVKCHK